MSSDDVAVIDPAVSDPPVNDVKNAVAALKIVAKRLELVAFVVEELTAEKLLVAVALVTVRLLIVPVVLVRLLIVPDADVRSAMLPVVAVRLVNTAVTAFKRLAKKLVLDAWMKIADVAKRLVFVPLVIVLLVPVKF